MLKRGLVEGFGSGGSECSGSSGCFQVHTASWFYVLRGVSPVCSKPRCFHFGILIVETLIPPFHLTCHFYHLITKERNGRVSVHNTVYQLAAHAVQKYVFLQKCHSSVGRGELTVKGHSGGFACFCPLTINCTYFKSIFSMGHFCSIPSGLGRFYTIGTAFGFTSSQCSSKINMKGLETAQGLCF